MNQQINQKQQPNRIFIDKKLVTKVIKDCRKRIAATHKFRTRLGLKQYDVILTKEYSVLKKIKGSFKEENMQTHVYHSVLGYQIDLYFHEHKLLIEINEN